MATGVKVIMDRRGRKRDWAGVLKARYGAMNGMIWTFFEKDKRFGMLALSIGSPARSRFQHAIVVPSGDVVKDPPIGIG